MGLNFHFCKRLPCSEREEGIEIDLVRFGVSRFFLPMQENNWI
jgi:hypothetical protein